MFISEKNLKLIGVIVGVLIVGVVAQQLVYRFVDLRGSQPIEIHDDNDDGEEHGHVPETPEEHAHE